MATPLETLLERVKEIRERIRERMPVGGRTQFIGGEVAPIKEIREKGLIAALEERFPKIKEIREKGAVGIIEERFPRVKEVREKGVLGEKLVKKQEEVTEKLKKELEGTFY